MHGTTIKKASFVLDAGSVCDPKVKTHVNFLNAVGGRVVLTAIY